MTTNNLLFNELLRGDITNEDLRDEFFEKFYNYLGIDNFMFDDAETDYPWGEPWNYDKCNLEGESIDEMAKLYAESVKDEILNLLKYEAQND